MRFLTRLIPVKWEVRPDYEEPVQGVPKLNDPSIQFDAPK
jgi:hypothetical protein